MYLLIIFSVATMIVRRKPTQEVLEQIYNAIQKNISNQECYYTNEEIKKLKQNEENIFIKGDK